MNARFAFILLLVVVQGLSACQYRLPDTDTPTPLATASPTVDATPTGALPTATATPSPDQEPTPVAGVEAFSAALVEQVANRDFQALQEAMTTPFALGAWRSEWQTLSPEEATAQLQSVHLPEAAEITFEKADIQALLDGTPPNSMLGPGVNVAGVLFSRGWAESGSGEALLFIVGEPAAGFHWGAFLYAPEGFAGGTSGVPPSDSALCPQVRRPALVLLRRDESYLIGNPLSGEQCQLSFPEAPSYHRPRTGGGDIFYVPAGQSFVVNRLEPNGTVTPLEFTRIETEQRSVAQDFIVSPDGRYIAWSAVSSKVDEPDTTVSDIWVAEIASGTVSAHITEFIREQPRILSPVRFDDDSRTLFYTFQPTGLGGSWIAFNGRYDNLFSTPVGGGVLTPLFDCADYDLFLCIGDFYLVNDDVAALAYTDMEASEIIILNGEGDRLNRIAPEGADYVGYPTFGPGGEMVFYSAELDEEEFIFPEMGRIYSVAPPTAAPEVVLSEPGLMTPQLWVDASHLVAGYTDNDSNWGEVLVGMDGALRMLEPWPEVTVIAVLKAPSQAGNEQMTFTASGISFAFDSSLANDIRWEVVPAVSEAEADGFTYAVMPEHWAFTFADPYVDPASLHRQTVNLNPQPEIFVFPVEVYSRMNQQAAEEIENLRELLQNRPVIVAEGGLPLLPLTNGQQALASNLRYFSFENGQGVRYLTQVNQEARPINNQELFYTFQGLTSDGQYYVAAFFPVSTSILPEESDIKDTDSFAANFDTYRIETALALEALDPPDFQPDLRLLDEVVRSLRVAPE